MTIIGILFAIGSLISWGFGDFFIQRSTRKVGIWETLFFIGFLGLIALFPFAKDGVLDIITNQPRKLIILILAAVVTLFTALFNFEALKRGKIAIIEPIVGMELPITIGLSITLLHERFNIYQALLSLAVFIGIMLAITEHHSHLHYHKRIFEKGVIFAGIAAVGMALTNFLTGVASQTTSPLIAIWFIHGSLAIMCLAYFVLTGKIKTVINDFRANPKIILAESFFDNSAWICFAYATAIIPISVAISVSESYIVLAVLLGIIINKEKLRWHQVAGATIAMFSVVALSAITG